MLGTREWNRQNTESTPRLKVRQRDAGANLDPCGGCSACHQMTRIDSTRGMTDWLPEAGEGLGLKRPCSINFFQRNLGNSQLQSVADRQSMSRFVTSSAGVPEIQRKCSCGGSSESCSDEESELEKVRTKLTVGPPNDVYEQEADRIADAVIQMPESQPGPNCIASSPLAINLKPLMHDTLLRQPADTGGKTTEEENNPPVDWNMPEPLESPTVVPASGNPQTQHVEKCTWYTKHNGVQSNKASEKTPVTKSLVEVMNQRGQPLDNSVRSFFEPRFGYVFGDVRIHTDARAAESASEYNALAYTLGDNMVFGAGQYAPDTAAGLRLIAHELSHVVQRNPSRSNTNSWVSTNGVARTLSADGNMILQRWSIGSPVPGINTIVCNGSGGVATQLGATGDAQQTACLRDCIEIHEQSHRADALAENANICSAATAGNTVRPDAGAQQKATEIKASNAEITCLRGKLAGASATCQPIINTRITQMEAYRDSFR
jgi:hypothetical protein